MAPPKDIWLPSTEAEGNALMESLSAEQKEAVEQMLADPVSLATIKANAPEMLSAWEEKQRPDAEVVARAVMRGEKNPLVVHESEARQREIGVLNTLDRMETVLTGVTGGLDGFGGEPVDGQVGVRKKLVRAGDRTVRRPPADATVVCHIVCKKSDGSKYESTREKVRSTTDWEKKLNGTLAGTAPGPRTLSLDEANILNAGVLKVRAPLSR